MAQVLRMMSNMRSSPYVSRLTNNLISGCRIVACARPREPLDIQGQTADASNGFRFLGIPCFKNTCRYLSTSTGLQAARVFTEKHEWVLMDGEIGTIGISDYAQEALGDVVYAQLPDVGSQYEQMDECGALESVKAASELYCPLTGEIVEKNTEVEETPALINQSCYDKGWLFKLKVTKKEELEQLMGEDTYLAFLKEEE